MSQSKGDPNDTKNAHHPTVRTPARRHMRRITFTSRVIGGTMPNKTITVLTYLASAILLAYALAVAVQQAV